MSTIGLFAMLVAFAATVISVVTLAAGHALRARETGETLSWAGRIAAILAFAAMTVACGVMVWCFLVGDYNIQYVLDNHVNSGGMAGTLYRISGLWAGREGSLLFWAWLISLFNAVVSLRRLNQLEPMDNMAVLVMGLVLGSFVGIMLFSKANMPFIVTDDAYYAEDGTLTNAAMLTGMNTLLQHWAMAIHPPTLFVGYAGLTVPFAYAIAAFVVNDSSVKWVLRSERYTLLSWLFLTIGIGLGSIWAYVVLGWGGYWGWDPVENASLLAWLVCVALVHSFAMYKMRGLFKRWAALCACLAFAFVIVGTFISRSGIVESVHAFEGDPVSLGLFGTLIVVSILAGVVGCIVRRKSFCDVAVGGESESMISRDGAFYVNNLVMVVMAVLLTYLTISSALPSWLPFGGQSVSSGTYDAIARPIGILYLLMMSACPLLGWHKTDPKAFARKAKVPGICAIVVFIAFMVLCALYLFPAYDAVIAQGGSAAESMLSGGPAIYYKGLTILGFAVASLLLMNGLFRLAGVLGLDHKKAASAIAAPSVADAARGVSKPAGKGRIARVGGAASHLALGVILVGLLGSSMYVTEVSGYLAYDGDTDSCSEAFVIKDYELEYTNSGVGYASSGADVVYTTEFDVYKNGIYVGHVAPSIQVSMVNQQQKQNAAVIHLPQEDLFVVFQGVSTETSSLSLDVKVNPLISFVWAGFGLLCLGMLLSMVGSRGAARQEQHRD